ncbi:hypothetical protein PIB30_042730 [Stylosanthes scabra]|uniref:Uncharacterized protein n=1 Tax=Stylosanthes scabra TaxID=79078 RepID=A0ABU6QER6_9FABA|nr:hypothetical protein [Stylosanthes scabra]
MQSGNSSSVALPAMPPPPPPARSPSPSPQPDRATSPSQHDDDLDYAEFGTEVAGESKRNERIATNPRRPLLDQMRTQQ